MGAFVYTAFFIWGCVSLSAGEMAPLNMEACDIGDVVQNECTKCTCTVRHVYECTAKPCKRTKAEDFKKVSKTCQPHKIYHQLSTICICREDGSWPHDSCYATFKALPEARIVKKKCTGTKYAIIGCNICMCNSRGEIESQRCTQNDCDDDSQTDHRRKTKTSHVYGNCLAQNWYSLAPCQFCYCLNNNKLMCNTGNVNVKGIELGSYNFSLCGPDYLKEALEFAKTSDTKGSLRVGGDIKTTKPRKHKAKDIQELFAKADEERMKQKKTEKKAPMTEHKESHKIPIVKEKMKQPSDESGSNESRSDDKSDKDDDTEDKKKVTMTQKAKNDKIDSVEEVVKKSQVKHKQASSDEKEDKDDDEDDDDQSTFDIGAAFKKTIPTLKKIFDVRRTVVLNSQTKCEPGTQTMVECNTCHCMKNGKMLCTDKKCD